MTRNVFSAALMSCVCAAALAAQQTNPPSQTSAQNTQNTKAQQVVLSGCLSNTPGRPTDASGGTTTTGMSQARYSLGHLDYMTSGQTWDEWLRTHPNPSASATSPAAGRPTELMLSTATGSNVDLSKYVGQNIQVTGTIGATGAPPNMGAGVSGSANSTGRTGGAATTGMSTQSNWPGFTVSSVKVLSKSCTAH